MAIASSLLPVGYNIRCPVEKDIPAILDLLAAHDLAETGEADRYEPEDIRHEWEDLDISRDAWVIIAPDGLLSGYGTVTVFPDSGRIFADGYVQPAQYGRGIGTALVELMEARAEEIVSKLPVGIRRVLVNNIIASSDAARQILEVRGYTLARVYFRMHIALNESPLLPQWPEGIRVRTCNGSEEDFHLAHETIEEGFLDHWGRTPRSFEHWRRSMVREDLDPSLWFFIQDGDKIAGAALCRVRDEGKGWVEQLAVLRPWRKRGLGMALLRHAFATFYQRGISSVGLSVDGQSLTGAQRLYERVGMSVTMRIGRYEKELRPGRDLLEEQQSH